MESVSAPLPEVEVSNLANVDLGKKWTGSSKSFDIIVFFLKTLST